MRRKRSFTIPSIPKEHMGKIVAVAGAVLIILFLGISSLRIEQEKNDLEERVGQIDEQISALQEQNETLQSGVQASHTEFFLERTARDTLGLKKEGEKAVSIVFPEQEEELVEEKGLFETILERLGF